jgi:hypothetical protein
MRYSAQHIGDRTMREIRLEPHRLATSLFLSQPDEAYEIALDFLNDALTVQNREMAVVWTAVLTMVEQMHADFEGEPVLFREAGSSSMM